MPENQEKPKKYEPTPEDAKPKEANPFHYDLMYPIGGRKEKSRTVGHLDSKTDGFVTQGVDITNKKTGEVYDGTSLIMNVKKRVDAEHFVKFYMSGLRDIFDLDSGAQKVLKSILLLYADEDNFSDLIYYNHVIARSYGYPHQRGAWRNGLNLLMVNEFLCPAAKGAGWYWLNPTLFYKGDRMVLVREYIKNPPKGTIEVKASKPEPDPVLDQQDLFTGKTKRDELFDGEK